MTEILWVYGEKKQLLPVFNGYLFHSKKVKNGAVTYWKCSVKGCNVYANYTQDGTIFLNKNHDHSPNEKKIYKMICIGLIRNKIRSTPFISAKSAFEDSLFFLSEVYLHSPLITRHFPSFSSVKSIIYRFKREFYPSSFSSLISNINRDVFNLPDQGTMLLVHETQIEPMIVLGDGRFISNFVGIDNLKIYMDGTFKSAPHEFYQLYIIHVEFNSQCFPIMYCFLCGKTEEIYYLLFCRIKEVLLQKNIEFSPNTVQIDFEYAAYNAIKRVFPNINIKGCFFHFGQAIWRKVVDLGLKTMFNEDVNFKECVQTITSLALVPIEFIDESWRIIKEMLINNTWQSDLLFLYIEETWLVNNRPLFDRQIWSQHGVFRGRTNNYAEGVHSKINSSITRSHPNFYELVDKLSTFQMLYSLEYQRLINGGPLKERKKIYIEQDKRIENLLNLFGNGLISLKQLLTGLAYAIKLNI
ncbi:hypothetical protein DMUE_1726 [Dictyocoela muelleri]|nr:hypothetical protein DMUE_1726 [Dictyocoela muelleri]